MSVLKQCVTSRVLQPFFVIASIAVLLASASVTSAQSKSTDINVSGAVAQPTVNRLGVTLGVDGGSLLKNLVVANPGLEAADYRGILRCGAGTADSCQAADAATAVPAGFLNGAHYQVMSGGAAGATGTVVSHTSGSAGSVLALDKTLSLSAGDYLSVEVVQPVSGAAGWSTNVTGGGAITAETGDLSPETPGKQALLLSAQGRGGSVRLSQEMDAQPGQGKLQLNGAYEVSFRAKGVGGNNQLNVSVAREASGNAPYLNRQVALTDGWAQYTLSFSASETGTQSSPLQLSFAAAGASIELDDVSLQQSNSSSANTTAFRDEVVNALQELHPGTLRMLSGGSDVLTQLASPFAHYNQGLSSDVTSVPATAYSIQEFLQLCATVGADPWITVPASTTPAEMTDLVQYLTGDGSDTWSALRISGGQIQPWTSVFGKVHIELENGTGISGSASQPMASSAYASLSNAVFGAARRSTGYSASKFDLILSGLGTSTSWNAAVLSASKQQDSLAIAPSLLLSSTDQSQGAPFGALFAEPELFNAPGGVVFGSLQVGATAQSASGRSTQINVSDSVLSSIAGAITQAQLKQLTPSLGLGIAEANSMLQMMRSGVTYQNASVLAQNVLNCSDGSSSSNCRSPEFLTQALANSAIGGNMLQTMQSGANPTWTQPITAGVQLKGGHLLQSFAFDNGTNLSVVVFNLSQTASLPVTFSGVDAPAGAVRMTQITSAAITDNNETANTVEPSAQTLSGFNGASGLSLPPFSMTVVSWTPAAVQTAAATPSSPSKKLDTMVKSSSLAAAVTQAAASVSSQPIVNCASGFASSGNCGVSLIGSGGQALAIVGSGASGPAPSLSGSRVQLIPTDVTHSAFALNYQTPVNAQAFTSTFTFIPNGWNIAFVLQNNTVTTAAAAGRNFFAGAGCEAGFFQAFGAGNIPPNNIFALELDQQSPLTNDNGADYGAPFTYSSVQIYKAGQSPCNPNDDQPNYYYTQKISTSPVSLNSPANSVGTTTGHTYSVTLNYDGSNLVMNMYDVTAGGSCPGSSCFTQTWTGVNIPSLVGGNTAYLGITGGTNSASSYPLYVNSLVYSDSALSSAASTPTFSPAAGTYTTSQSVTISDSTAGATIYYTTNGTTPTTSSTKYSGPITVSSTETLEAIAVASGYSNSAVASAAYTINVAPAMPTFSVAPGTYASMQTVAISDATSGASIYYTTNGATPTTSSTKYSGPITVSSTETLEAVAAVGDPTMSAVATATYVINSSTGAPILPTPTFSVASGTYSAPQSVTIADATPGATIYYTTNGTKPTTSSTKYSGAITVGSTETLEAIATASGYSASAVANAAYVINTSAPSSPSSGSGTSSTSAGGTTYINNPNGGFKASSFDLNGGATVTSGGLVQLTNGGANEARSAWFNTRVPVQNFITDFTFQQLSATADGMTFTIQGSAPTAVGGAGESLGYQGIPNSVAIKFDLYDNDGEGNDSTGLYTNGASPTVPSLNLSSTAINLHSGDVMHAHMVYNGTNLTMTLIDTVTGGSLTEVCPINIPSIVGSSTAYVGFTGGTGGATSTQNVLSWTFVGASPAPTFSPAGGVYSSAQSVTITDATPGVAIYYTTNGTTPSTSSTKYTGPISVSKTETVEAIAVGSNGITSLLGTAVYTLSEGSTIYINNPSGGFKASSFDLNGGATVTSGGLVQLTDGGAEEARSAWLKTRVPVQNFITDFTFQQLSATADGMTFTVQGSGPTALGSSGGSLGYQGMPDSVAVKFDLYSNDGEGDDSTGLYAGGASPTVPAVNLSSTSVNLHIGDVMHAHMVYDGTNLTMTLTDTITGGSVTEVFPVNIPSVVGSNTAYVGFTGGTGAEAATQNVLSWTFSTP